MQRRLPAALALIALFLHLVANPHYGYFRDELYFIMCGTRPAWGYVDQPPLVPFLAAGSQAIGHSLFLLRAVPALFAAASIGVTCALVIDLGGGAFAQILGSVAAFFCPVLMSFGMKLSTDTPSLLFWPLIALLVLRARRALDPRLWLLAGVVLGLAFQSKYSVVFWALALLGGLVVSPGRQLLWSRWPLLGAGVAVAIALPNVLWQARLGLPMLELLRNGQLGKNVVLKPLEFLSAELLITGPILAGVWIAGLFWLARDPRTRFLAVGFLFLMAEMIAFRAKHYYPADVFPILFAAGGVALESWTERLRALRLPLVATLVAASLILIPYALPILPIPTFLAYHQTMAPILHLDQLKTENQQMGSLPQDWADMQGWEEMAASVSRVAQSLSPAERAQAVISAQDYGQAAALEFFAEKYDLPPVMSGHNQYYLWGPPPGRGEVLIDIDGDCGQSLALYRSATVGGRFEHPLVMPYENELPLMICRGLNRPLDQIWPRLKKYL